MTRHKPNDQDQKPSMLQLMIAYLSNTHPLVLLMHLAYIIIVCATLSVSYVVAFHWSALIKVWEEAHDIKGFSANLKSSVETDISLNSSLADLLSQSNAIRAYIYRYHNGLAAVSSVPFFFQTNTHEVIAPGANRLLPYEQRIPASFNIAINNQFVKNQCAMAINADSDKDNSNFFYWQSRGAKAFIRCPIYMKNGDLFGFVGLDFANNPADQKRIGLLTSDATRKIGTTFEQAKK